MTYQHAKYSTIDIRSILIGFLRIVAVNPKLRVPGLGLSILHCDFSESTFFFFVGRAGGKTFVITDLAKLEVLVDQLMDWWL